MLESDDRGRRKALVVRRAYRAVAAVLVWLGVMIAVPGYITYNDHVMVGGLQSRQYWFDGSSTAYMESLTYSAKWRWGNGTSLISLAETSTVGSAEFLLYKSGTIYDAAGACAGTLHTDASLNGVNENSSDWSRAKILISTQMLNGDFGCPNELGIVEHEFGHAFGLDHSYQFLNVMYTYVAGTSIDEPSENDLDGIRHLY